MPTTPISKKKSSAYFGPDLMDLIPYQFYNLMKDDLQNLLMTRCVEIKIRIDTLPAPKAVYVVGNWDNWEKKHEMQFNSYSQVWLKYLNLKPGRYYYKFNDDHQWFVDHNNVCIEVDDESNDNNTIIV